MIYLLEKIRMAGSIKVKELSPLEEKEAIALVKKGSLIHFMKEDANYVRARTEADDKVNIKKDLIEEFENRVDKHVSVLGEIAMMLDASREEGRQIKNEFRKLLEIVNKGRE